MSAMALKESKTQSAMMLGGEVMSHELYMEQGENSEERLPPLFRQFCALL